MLQKQLALKQQLPVFLHVHRRKHYADVRLKIERNDQYLQVKTAQLMLFWNIQKLGKLFTEHSLPFLVSTCQSLEIFTCCYLHPWCQIPSKEQIPVVAAQILQCLVRWDSFSSLCCSYCLVLIIPPTAPAMQTFFQESYSHTANWLRAVTSPLLSPHSSVVCAAFL